MKAYMTAALTDMYGDVPYFNALNGKEGNVTPAYDAQEDIYRNAGGILDNLDQAVLSMQNYQGALTLGGDIIYNGNLNNWIKFANSLKIKYLIK